MLDTPEALKAAVGKDPVQTQTLTTRPPSPRSASGSAWRAASMTVR